MVAPTEIIHRIGVDISLNMSYQHEILVTATGDQWSPLHIMTKISYLQS